MQAMWWGAKAIVIIGGLCVLCDPARAQPTMSSAPAPAVHASWIDRVSLGITTSVIPSGSLKFSFVDHTVTNRVPTLFAVAGLIDVRIRTGFSIALQPRYMPGLKHVGATGSMEELDLPVVLRGTTPLGVADRLRVFGLLGVGYSALFGLTSTDGKHASKGSDPFTL